MGNYFLKVVQSYRLEKDIKYIVINIMNDYVIKDSNNFIEFRRIQRLPYAFE